MKTIIKVTGCLAVLLAATHTAEWFLEGRKVAAATDIPVKEALPKCLLKGFLWWKPLKEELQSAE